MSERTPVTRRGLALCVGLAALAYHGLAFWDPRTHAYPALVGWFFESSDASPQVILAVVAALLFVRRRELRRAVGGEPALALGALGLGGALAFQLWANWVDAPDLMLVSLALAALGGALALSGRALARELLPPLALLVFALPIPGALHNLVVFPAQLASANLAELGLLALGYDVVNQSDILSIRGEKFEVIETCSGLRSLQTLGLLAAAWAVYFRCSARHAAWLLASAPVIAFLTNGIRVMVLVIDTRPEVRESHTAQGLVMFVIGTLALSGVDRALLRLLRRPAGGAAPPAPQAPRPARGPLPAVAFAFALLAASALVLPRLRPAAPPLPAVPELPRELRGWSVEDYPLPGHFLGSVHFPVYTSRVYRRGTDEAVSALLGWDDRRQRTRSILSTKNAVPSSGWVVEERSRVVLEPGALPMERVVAHRFAERSMALHTYLDMASAPSEALRSALALDQPGSPFARRSRGGMLRLSVLVRPGPEGVAQAEARLRAFYAQLAPALGW